MDKIIMRTIVWEHINDDVDADDEEQCRMGTAWSAIDSYLYSYPYPHSLQALTTHSLMYLHRFRHSLRHSLHQIQIL